MYMYTHTIRQLTQLVASSPYCGFAAEFRHKLGSVKETSDQDRKWAYLKPTFQTRSIPPSREKTLPFGTSLGVNRELCLLSGQGRRTLCLVNLSLEGCDDQTSSWHWFSSPNYILISKFCCYRENTDGCNTELSWLVHSLRAQQLTHEQFVFELLGATFMWSFFH